MVDCSRRSTPMVHEVQDPPVCSECSGFNFSCQQCVGLLDDEKTTVSQLMAIGRQWESGIQTNMDRLVKAMLQKNAHPDDRDQLTDMTLLHYVCKSGTDGIGDSDKSLKMATKLIEEYKADPNLICKWNDMSALHIATYFDVAPLVGYLVTLVEPEMLNRPSQYLAGKTPLHIAASNLCLKSACVLLSSGANVMLKDEAMRTPLDCVPVDLEEPEKAEVSLELRTMLEEATLMVCGEPNGSDLESIKTAKVVLSALGFEIGDRVAVRNGKVGILRFCGPTQFAPGIWTGIELEEPIGKNDGSIDGIRYFSCPAKHGIFAPINRISKLDPDYYDIMMGPSFDSWKSFSRTSPKYLSLGYDVSNVQSKIDTGLNSFSDAHLLSSSKSSLNSEDVAVGSKVYLTDKKTGVVRFIGITKFAAGIWYGIELTRPLGKNDGSVQGVRYFRCEERYGIFVPFSRIAGVLHSYRPRTRNSIKASSREASESDDSDMSLNISGTSSLDFIRTTHNNSNSPSNKPATTRTNGNFGMRRTMSLSRSISVTSTITARRSKIGSPKEESWLRVGVNVLVNGKVGSIRYIGPVHFTEGTFIGIELRHPDGKNDGMIEGKRYFACKPNHGLLVSPRKVTIRGINAAKLLNGGGQ